MANVRLSYLYRDGSNYKKWAELVFASDGSVELSEVERRIRTSLFTGELFIADWDGDRFDELND